jgi:flagellar hook assembly protein FlgD
MKTGRVAITIRDAVGNTVRTLTVPGLRGLNRAEWDVRGDNGRDAGPGAYLVEVTAGSRHAAATLVIGPS